MTIYKFKDINTKNFHHAMCSVTASANQYTVAGYNGTTTATNATTATAKFIPVARSTIYNATDFSRRIRVEASPTQVKVYYKGSTDNNDATVLDPTNAGYTELTDLNLVNFSTASVTQVGGTAIIPLQTGTTVLMDESYINQTEGAVAYGFGPMAAYILLTPVPARRTSHSRTSL
jgi:hypothetical protein